MVRDRLRQRRVCAAQRHSEEAAGWHHKARCFRKATRLEGNTPPALRTHMQHLYNVSLLNHSGVTSMQDGLRPRMRRCLIIQKELQPPHTPQREKEYFLQYFDVCIFIWGYPARPLSVYPAFVSHYHSRRADFAPCIMYISVMFICCLLCSLRWVLMCSRL